MKCDNVPESDLARNTQTPRRCLSTSLSSADTSKDDHHILTPIQIMDAAKHTSMMHPTQADGFSWIDMGIAGINFDKGGSDAQTCTFSSELIVHYLTLNGLFTS